MYQYYSNLQLQQNQSGRSGAPKLCDSSFHKQRAEVAQSKRSSSFEDSAARAPADAQIRKYSTKELISLFKRQGHFQNPLDCPEFFEIPTAPPGAPETDVQRILKELLNPKPDVVLEHLKGDNFLPVSSTAHISEKILETVTDQLNHISARF